MSDYRDEYRKEWTAEMRAAARSSETSSAPSSARIGVRSFVNITTTQGYVMADQYVIHKYEHGGGRVFIQRDNGSRDLVIDLYEPSGRRDQILDALMAAEILPPKSECVINEY